MSPRRAALVAVLAHAGCFVGYPTGQPGAVWLPDVDTGYALDDPACDAVSREPDDGEAPDRVSQIGVATAATRTFCGRIAKAGNDGANYTGDLDVALVNVIDGGKLVLRLSWEDARTDLDLLAVTDPSGESIELSEDGRLDLRVAAGIYTVGVAGRDGPATDYWLDVTVE
ncbi:MAG: hypothetical protein R3F59_08605 [Myxococcota bacterium]